MAMSVPLTSRARKLGLVLACVVVLGIYAGEALGTYLASVWGTSEEIAKVRLATRLQPRDAEYHYRLAVQEGFAQQNFASALQDYETAVRLNPHHSEYWLGLATAYEVLNQGERQNWALRQAIAAEPTSTNVAWTAANHFLAQGQTQPALQEFRIVAAYDPLHAAHGLWLCWRATGDINRVLSEVMPPKVEPHFALMALALEIDNFDAASAIWRHLTGLKLPLRPQSAFPYLRDLIRERRIADAQRVWREMIEANPSLRGYGSSAANLLVNGGFEEDILNGGFDWQYTPTPDVTASVDTSEFQEGSRSLLVSFDGRWKDAGLTQLVPAAPRKTYQFSAASKTRDIEGANPPILVIQDAFTGDVLMKTDPFSGSSPWRDVSSEFTTGPETQLLLIRIVRDPGLTPSRGSLWLDEMKLAAVK